MRGLPLLLLACAHAPPATKPVPLCELYVGAEKVPRGHGKLFTCGDAELERLRNRIHGEVRRSPRIAGTDFHALCVDRGSDACGEESFIGAAPDLAVRGWERPSEIESLLGAPRLDDTWRDAARSQLLATGRFRSVEVRIGLAHHVGQIVVVLLDYERPVEPLDRAEGL